MRKYFQNKIPTWNNFVQHPDYDEFWQKDSPLSYVSLPEIPILHVGGYYDQEDINGPQLMYRHMEKRIRQTGTSLFSDHGIMGNGKALNAESLGKISFGSNTAEWFHNLQKRWFDYWLKGEGDGNFSEAFCFQTGTNVWRTYQTWPPKNAEIKSFIPALTILQSFTKPVTASGL